MFRVLIHESSVLQLHWVSALVTVTCPSECMQYNNFPIHTLASVPTPDSLIYYHVAMACWMLYIFWVYIIWHLSWYIICMDDRWQDLYIFLVIFIHFLLFTESCSWSQWVVEEKDGEVLCTLILRFFFLHALHKHHTSCTCPSSVYSCKCEVIPLQIWKWHSRIEYTWFWFHKPL